MILLSPRVKILLYIFLVISVFVSHSFTVYLVLLCAVSIFAVRVPLSVLKRGAIPIMIFLAFTFISNVLYTEGEVIYKIYGLAISHEGIIRGGQLTLRLFILILGAKILTATTRAEDLVSGMGTLLGPVGRIHFVRELICTMSLTLRLLPVIYNEAMELYKDVKNSDEDGLAAKIRLSVSLLTPLFIRSLEKAKKMSETEKTYGS